MNAPKNSDDIRIMLGFVFPANHDIRYRIGMAIKSELGDAGFDVFDEWSKQADTYNSSEIKSRWNGFSVGGGISIGTLIAEAKQGGFDAKTLAPAQPISKAEKERLQQERLKREQIEAAALLASQTAAASEAAKLWAAASEVGESAYLKRKQVKAHGVRFSGDAVLIPLHDDADNMWAVQHISPTGTKRPRPLKGARVSGCFHVLGNAASSEWVLIAEGYATAATLHEATGFAAVMAYAGFNLKHAAAAMRQRYPAAKLLICADDDQKTASKTGKNAGLNYAIQAAKAVAGFWCQPLGLQNGGSDFNDLAVSAGADEVKAQIMAAIAATTTPAPATSNNATMPAKLPETSATAMTDAAPWITEGEQEKPHHAAVIEASKPAPNIARKEPAKAKSKPAARSNSGGADGQASRPFFNVNEGGVWFHGFSQQGDALPPQWICSTLQITAKSRDAVNGEWGYLLEFNDADGNPKRWAMPASMLAGDGTMYRSTLLGMGLQIGAGTTAKNHLTVYIQTQQTDDRVRCVDRMGWHDSAYVLPDRTINEGAEKVMFQSVGGVVSQFKQRGTLDDWRDNIAKHCQGNARTMFCVSVAFAAPLLHLAGVQSALFHIWGDTSTGKSTAVRVAASVYGGKDYARNWRMTDNSLETVAVQHSDALLVLDEIAQVDSKVVGDIAYMLANETGKGRATQTATAKRVASWRLLGLSDGEVSLAQHMEQAGKKTKGGHEVRMVHITADAGKGLGIYDTVHDFANGVALSNHFNAMVKEYYGTAGMAFIEAIAQDAETLPPALKQAIADRMLELVPAGAHGQVSRVAELFALVAIAGEMASNMGITGWPAGEADAAARVCFDDWLSSRGGAGNSEHNTMAQQMAAWFQANGDARFTVWHRAADDHRPNTINRAGFKKMVKDGTPIDNSTDKYQEYGDVMHPADADATEYEYYVLPEVFKTEICKGFNHKAMAKLAILNGALIGQGTSSTRSERLPTMGKVQCYKFNASVMNMAAVSL